MFLEKSQQETSEIQSKNISKFYLTGHLCCYVWSRGDNQAEYYMYSIPGASHTNKSKIIFNT
ncbi:MAG: hypothetical protein ACJA2R_000532 [Saprospiraceae bacterium]|jgi:hypothetical protein|tara:strand:+ start:629 stop:814 length:186 start_codon:yes stop_codon:yes gene_type:complete